VSLCISVVLARGILSELNRRGLDPYAVLAEAEVDRARLGDYRQTVSFAELERLRASAVRVSGDSAFFLELGHHAPLSMLQVVSQVALAQPTLRLGLTSLSRYLRLIVELSLWELRESDDQAWLVNAPQVELKQLTPQLTELSFAFIARLRRAFTPDLGSRADRRDEGLTEVRFRHQAPSYRERCEEVFGCPVRFEQSENALCFARAELSAVNPYANDFERERAEALAEQALRELRSRRAGESVMTRLGAEHSWKSIDVRRIAQHAELELEPLRRKLARQGTTLTTLLDQTRFRLAREALCSSDETVREVSERLGFSEPSAFVRAFRRWEGRTPGSYRRSVRLQTAEG
jgi:AraC-like DNA-binding protein